MICVCKSKINKYFNKLSNPSKECCKLFFLISNGFVAKNHIKTKSETFKLDNNNLIQREILQYKLLKFFEINNSEYHSSIYKKIIKILNDNKYNDIRNR